MLKLRVTVNGKVVREVELDGDLIIGRKEPADIVVVDGQISSRHARLRADGERVLVTDLGSTNGTRIDEGERLAANTDTPLERGQKLLVGPAVIEIVGGGGTESDSGFAKTEKTVVVGAGQMQSLLVQVARFKAAHPRIVMAAEHTKKTIELTEMESVIGREPGAAQVVVPHQSVSSRHARLKFESGKFYLEDLGSANGTFVEGNRILALTPLESQTAVTFGTVDCLFVTKAPEAGGAHGSADPMAEVLTEHAVRMGKATQQQARDALGEHRSSGRTLGEIFVEKGIFTPKEWSEVYRQRSVLATLRPQGGGSGGSNLKLLLIFGIAALLVALAYIGWKGGWFGGGAPK